jgi:NAD(P)H-hydrate epimerase
MVTLGVPETLADIFQARVTEEMVLPLPDAGDGQLSFQAKEIILRFASERADVLAVGPGMGASEDTRRLVRQLIGNSTSPIVIDADGINSIEGDAEILRKSRSPLILTPHIGEMAGLLTVRQTDRKRLLEKIAREGVLTAVSFAKETGTYLILKGAPTIVSEPEGKAFINTTGNPGMATAGAGDVLTGIVAGFLGQGMNPLDAALCGVYMHGLSGDIAAAEKGMHSMIATDLIDHLPGAFRSLMKDRNY